MQTRITVDEMHAAARQLAKSEQGRAAMKRLQTWLEEDNTKLTLLNQRALLALLGGAWSGRVPQACAVMRTALAEAETRMA